MSEEKRRRIDMKVQPVTRALIEEAAKITGETLTGFIVTAAIKKAEKILKERKP